MRNIATPDIQFAHKDYACSASDGKDIDPSIDRATVQSYRDLALSYGIATFVTDSYVVVVNVCPGAGRVVAAGQR
ncbi:hypothetical protein ACN9M0_04490 [Streptomyces sp. R-07]|uniref:hypothetical protein n=1 Tax=unclassified Streptomyces TaxID=2593676 RepID=UPI0037CCF4E5